MSRHQIHKDCPPDWRRTRQAYRKARRAYKGQAFRALLEAFAPVVVQLTKAMEQMKLEGIQ